MAHSPQSPRLTEAYRSRVLALGARVETAARNLWPQIEELDTTAWPEQTAATVTRAQVEAVRLSAAYLGSYVRSETGSGRIPAIPTADYAGVSRDGRPLAEALQSPLIGVRVKLKDGTPFPEALAYGLQRALRMVAFEAVQTARDALLDGIDSHEKVDGWERAVAGTCAACMALSGSSGPRFPVHENCECIPAPTVIGVTNRFPLPSGAALFKAMPEDKQVAAIGEEPARLVRDGEADLKDFVKHEERDALSQPFITQRPVEQVAP